MQEVANKRRIVQKKNGIKEEWNIATCPTIATKYEFNTISIYNNVSH